VDGKSKARGKLEPVASASLKKLRVEGPKALFTLFRPAREVDIQLKGNSKKEGEKQLHLCSFLKN